MLELRRAPCALGVLGRQQVAARRVAPPGRPIRLHTPADRGGAGPPPVIPVKADAARLGQVVVNYVTNALKYAPPDRPVDVSVETRRGWARVAVCDQGPGLPKEERARGWEVFHRAPGVAPPGGAQGRGQGGSRGRGPRLARAVIAAPGG